MTNRLTINEMGGKPMLQKISKIFYDKVYADPWLGLYFANVPQMVIESQQVDFMNDALGGEACYCGKLPIPAHKHMMITKDLFNRRQELLKLSLKEAEARIELIQAWLKIDEAFSHRLIKKSRDECVPRFRGDDIIDFDNPEKYKKIA